MSVVFPDPDGPITATSSPRSMRRSMPRNASTLKRPDRYDFVIATSSITGSDAVAVTDACEPIDAPRSMWFTPTMNGSRAVSGAIRQQHGARSETQMAVLVSVLSMLTAPSTAHAQQNGLGGIIDCDRTVRRKGRPRPAHPARRPLRSRGGQLRSDSLRRASAFAAPEEKGHGRSATMASSQELIVRDYGQLLPHISKPDAQPSAPVSASLAQFWKQLKRSVALRQPVLQLLAAAMTSLAHPARSVPQPPRQLIAPASSPPAAGWHVVMHVFCAALQLSFEVRKAVEHPRMHVPRSCGAEFARQSCLHASAVVRAVWMQAFFCMAQPRTHCAADVPAATPGGVA
jgi:hypothetical protein